MTVSVADIDRWDAGDVREVFHATRNRAEAAFEAADGIATLPAFGTWGGEASEAARQAIEATRKDLDAHGNEALAVAQAAATAADDIEQVKSDLAQLRADAESLGMVVDPATSTILPGPSMAGAPPMEIELKQEQLQPRLNAILAEAAAADTKLTHAINMAIGKEPLPGQPITKADGQVDPSQNPNAKALQDDLNRANDKSVLDAIERVKAAQAAYDKAAAEAYTHGPGSPEGQAALAQLPKLKQDLASALDDLGKIPDYSQLDPVSLRADANGNVFFRYPLNGQMAEVSGTLKNGTGQLFDKGRLTYLTYENGKLVGTRVLDEGRAIATPEPLLTAVTTAVGAGPMVKGGEVAWLGLRSLFGADGAAAGAGVTSDNVIPRALELATARAESASHQLATLGPGSWGAVSESMSARAAAYQMQITGHPITEGYIVNGVKFDGFADGVLNDAKSYYSQFTKDGEWRPWFDPVKEFVTQAQRQVEASGGTPIQWVFAEPQTAAMVKELLADYPELARIAIKVVPPS